jgi:ribosome-binding protein aMBF1 (putative translation factor)
LPTTGFSSTLSVCNVNNRDSEVVDMAIKFEDYMAKLPKKRQQAIKKRAAELIVEEATLRQLREARERSQVEMAEKLHIKQAAVSKLERRTDMYLSTLRSYIEAMGGKLEIVARFPQRAVRIMQFETLDSENRTQR